MAYTPLRSTPQVPAIITTPYLSQMSRTSLAYPGGAGTALTWACYTVAIAPLMRKYSPYRISAVVLALGWLPLALVSIPQISRQEFHFGTLTWIGFAYAVVGPLFLTNILWFTAIDRVGP